MAVGLGILTFINIAGRIIDESLREIAIEVGCGCVTLGHVDVSNFGRAAVELEKRTTRVMSSRLTYHIGIEAW